jgi:hypothetical protein
MTKAGFRVIIKSEADKEGGRRKKIERTRTTNTG